MNRGIIKRLGDQTVDVQLSGSAATLPGVLISDQIDRSTLKLGMAVLVGTVNDRSVVLHTLAGEQRVSTTDVRGSDGGSVVINNALLADGSVPLTGNLPVTPGVTIDGYDISVLGQTIDNLQAADSVARTGHTVLTHASHLVATVGPNDDQLLIRHGIFRDKESLMLSNTAGEVETMRVIGNPVATVDDRGALCYRYTVTRRVATSPNGIVVGWAAATLVNGLTHKGFISVDARENSVAAPNLRFVLHTDIDAGATEQIFRIGNLYGILGNNQTDFGFATGRLNTGDRYLAYNYSRNLLALRGADISLKDDAGVEVFRVWGVAEDDHQTGDARLGHPSGGNIQTVGSDVDFHAGGQRVLSLTPLGSRFRGMIWSGTQPGPQVGIGEENGQGLIAARNAAGVGQFVVRTGEINVHVHMGNPVTEGGYAQFANGEFTTDGIIRARAFELLGGGTIGGGVVLTNAGKFTAGTGNNVAVIDGENATWRVYAGHADPTIAPFRVDQTGEVWMSKAHVAGEVTASSGSIGGWTINSSYLGATNVGMSPADYPFYAGATYANRTTAPYRVTPAGVLTATSGTVGGWTLGASSLTGGNATLHNSGYLSLGTGNDIARLDAVDALYRLWAGNAIPASAPFRVTKAGALTASDATITGTINATAGNITGSLYVGGSGNRLHLDGANKRFESTTFASGTSGFRVEGETGDAEFNNITVRGAIAASVIQYGYVQATAGSIWVTKAAGKTKDWFILPKASWAYLDIADPDGIAHATAGALWSVGDIVRLNEPLVTDFWGAVTAKTDMSTYWRLTVEDRLFVGDGTFAPGATVLNYGQSGDGVVRITADASNNPYVSIATHAGSPWTTLTERARLGNLTGISGASGYGLWTDNGFFTGTVNANAGDIGGWTISSGHLYAGAASTRVGMLPASYPFYAGDNIASEAPFRVNNTGTLTATNANITGTVNAGSGTIGSWTINSAYLAKDTGVNSTSSGMSPADYPFYAGSTYANRASAPFRVDPAGGLYATAGSVGGFTISYTEGLFSGTGTSRVQMKPGSGFWAGATARDDAPFRVTNAGALTSTSGSIAGWSIESTKLTSGSGDNLIELDTANHRIKFGQWSHIRGHTDGMYLTGVASIDEARVVGTLSHGGSSLGFFNVSPVTRPAAYTFSNGTTDRTINCDSTTVDELADVVYTMWSDLRNLGLLQ